MTLYPQVLDPGLLVSIHPASELRPFHFRTTREPEWFPLAV
ncbi:MAG: hypothetical protein ACM3ZE_21485 [Myxococcales bacterium]